MDIRSALLWKFARLFDEWDSGDCVIFEALRFPCGWWGEGFVWIGSWDLVFLYVNYVMSLIFGNYFWFSDLENPGLQS